MQAFRTEATVDEDRELRITEVPFPSGAELEVILLERESQQPPIPETRASDAAAVDPRLDGGRTSSAADDNVKDRRKRDAQDLVREQYQLARQYPGEYVVLVGDRIVYHDPDRQSMFRAYKRAFADFPSENPVVVEPGARQKKPLIARGRILKKPAAK